MLSPVNSNGAATATLSAIPAPEQAPLSPSQAQPQPQQTQPQQQQQPATAGAPAAAKKKKITRLVPAEESLAAIEECTEHSEDSETLLQLSSSSFSNHTHHKLNNSRSKIIMRDAPNVLGETTDSGPGGGAGGGGDDAPDADSEFGAAASPPSRPATEKQQAAAVGMEQAPQRLNGSSAPSPARKPGSVAAAVSAINSRKATGAAAAGVDETSSNGTEKTVNTDQDDDEAAEAEQPSAVSTFVPVPSASLPQAKALSSSPSPPPPKATTPLTVGRGEPSPTKAALPSIEPPTPVRNNHHPPPPPRSPAKEHVLRSQAAPHQPASSHLQPAPPLSPPPPSPSRRGLATPASPAGNVPSDPPSTFSPTGAALHQSINLSSLANMGPDYDDSNNDTNGPTENDDDLDEFGEDEGGRDHPSSAHTNNKHGGSAASGLGGSSRAEDGGTGVFDFDDDFPDEMEGAGKDEEEEILTWRLDPSASLSDWTLVVSTREGTNGSANHGSSSNNIGAIDHQQTFTYHVHKNILAVGPRKSDYFVNVFRAAAKASPPGPAVTEVVLSEVAARAVPYLLDYMYSVEGNLDIDSKRACGLRHLAQFFGVRALHKRVTDFIQKDLTMSTVGTYYFDVVSLRDEKLLVNIAKFCSKNILKIDTAFPLVEVMDPYFFSKLLTSQYINTKEKRYHCSLLVAEYCRMNKKRLDSKRFLMLTDESSLPCVHYSAALSLMEIEADVVVTTSLESMMGMTSLQTRCVRDLSTHWRALIEMDMQTVTRVCRKLPSSVVSELLVRSLSNAKRKLAAATADGEAMEVSSKHSMGTIGTVGTTSSRQSTRTRDRGDKHERGDKQHPHQPHQAQQDQSNDTPRRPVALKKELRDLKKEYESKLEEMRQAHAEEVTRLKKEYDTNLVRLRDILIDKDKTISKFWNEIKSFERLPNSLDGKVVVSGRQHEASFMPEVRPTSVDGYLYVSKKGGAKFPLFYYKKDEREKSESAASVGTR